MLFTVVMFLVLVGGFAAMFVATSAFQMAEVAGHPVMSVQPETSITGL
jgi:hypothetical protein